MYKYANNVLPPALNYLYTENCEVQNYPIRQNHVNKSNINNYSKYFGNTSARIWNAMQSKIEVNVSICTFIISSKNYLQEHSLKLKYTK